VSVNAARSPQLDGLRAIAAGTIFLTHLASMSTFTAHNAVGPLFARMNVGVALFFVLSGYLLYRPWVLARLEGRRGPSVRRYALRRATRILPAYWLALAVFAVLLPAWVNGATGSEWWVYFGLLQVYSETWILHGLGVAWSLSTEVAFYIVLPLLAYLGLRTLGRRGRRDQIRLELAVLATSAVVAMLIRDIGHRAEWAHTFDNTLVGKWPWFALGMALAVASAAWAGDRWGEAPRLLRSARRQPWLWWLAAGVVIVFASLEVILPRDVFTMDDSDLQVETLLFGLFAALLVTPLVFGDPSARRSPAGVLATPVAVWFGTVSYGIFLWHLPLIGWTISRFDNAPVIVLGLVSLGLTTACAATSWYLLERPLMKLTARTRRSRPDRDPARDSVTLEPAP
jgi:peptidoglycan/LPS O-acetylase OafA/YrhL